MTKEAMLSLSASLVKETPFVNFGMWIVGETPLITHAWSEKAKREMLDKQLKIVKPKGREKRDPDADFVNSLYEMVKADPATSTPAVFGFPTMGIKECILDAAHKDKGIPKTIAMRALYLRAEMVRVRPARQGAICDMPLARIHGSVPEMREDMVRVGVGMNKTASLAYRGQFTVWAMRITGKVNTTVLPPETLAFLVNESGQSCGIGEWRNEKHGVFGTFHLADPDEEKVWNAYAFGKGKNRKMPVPASYSLIAGALENEAA